MQHYAHYEQLCVRHQRCGWKDQKPPSKIKWKWFCTLNFPNCLPQGSFRSLHTYSRRWVRKLHVEAPQRFHVEHLTHTQRLLSPFLFSKVLTDTRTEFRNGILGPYFCIWCSIELRGPRSVSVEKIFLPKCNLLMFVIDWEPVTARRHQPLALVWFE